MLELNISTILLEMANFLVLAFILYRFLFTPLQNTLKKRAVETTRAWDEAKLAKTMSEETIRQYEEKSNNIDAEIAARKNEARIIIEQTRQQMLHEVQTEVETIQAQTQETLARMRSDALEQHREEIGTLASDFVTNIMQDLVTPQLQKAYRDAFLDQINQADLTSFTQGTPPGERVFIRVITASTPTSSYHENLDRLLKQKLPQEPELIFEVNPNLIAGGVLQFESELVDGSLQGQIAQLKERYLEAT
jgi:F-type H+-transporting ATPase subunit b